MADVTAGPPIPPPPDTPPKPTRPTTRAGRRAASAARRAAGKPDTRPSPPGSPSPRKAQLQTRLTDTLVTIGHATAGIGAIRGSAPVQADGVLIVQHAPNVSEALTRVADQDPRVKAALERVLSTSVYGQLTAALLPLCVGIAGNHGLVPPAMAAAMTGTLAGDLADPVTEPSVADVQQRAAAYMSTHPTASPQEAVNAVMAERAAA